MIDPKTVPQTIRRWKFKPTRRNWAAAAASASLLIISLAGGISGFLVMLGLIAMTTGIYTLVTGRASWASIPSKKIAGIVVVVSILLTGAGAGPMTPPVEDTSAATPTATGSAATRPAPTKAPAKKPTPLPSVEFTAGDPGEPSTIAESPEAAAVAIADTALTNTTSVTLLSTIAIKGKSPKTGYDRTRGFGTAWLDVDRNGCDTRNDILARDLLTSVKQGTCRVMSGSFLEPYTGRNVSFLRGNKTSALVQIDHVVALSNAWQTGAQQLTVAQRISLANDPMNLLAVDGRSNSQKGDGDTATWLPSNKAFRCDYVSRQVSVKATYGLWVTQAEHDAMARVLADCPDARALTSSFAPAPVAIAAPAPAPAPAPAKPKAPPAPAPAPAPTPPAPAPTPPAPAPTPPAPAPTEKYYANCAAVRAAGAAPILRGQPGYSSKLDRDGDGIGCE